MRGSSNRAARLRRYGVNVILGLVYVGIPVFAVLAFYPVVTNWHDRAAELQAAEGTLGRWLRSMSLPTQTRVEQERNYTAGMVAEYSRARSYYESRDRPLERSILDGYTGDPIQVKLKYVELRASLATKGHCPDARKFLPVYPWESPAKTPPPSELKAIEKRACIVDALVGLLAPGGACAIDSIAVGNPVKPSENESTSARDGSGAEPPATGESAGYVFWPVDLEFTTPFPNVGEVLGRLVTPPVQCPPLLVHSVVLTGLEGGRMKVSVGLRVVDFD